MIRILGAALLAVTLPVSAALAQVATPKVIAAQTVASADGVPVAWREWGKGDTTLVFIHGWSCDSGYWDAQLPVFARDHRVIALDLAGHGASGLGRTAWTMQAFGEDVAAVIRKAGVKRVILIGHSMGGPVALETARLLGPQVIGVIGVDTLADVGGRTIDPAMIEQYMASLRKDTPSAIRSLVSSLMFPKTADPALVRKIADDMATAPPQVAIGAMEGLMAYSPDATAAALKPPIVTINADYQPAMDVAKAQKVVPGFRLVTFTGTGHFPQIEAPERFNTALQAEVARILAAK